MAKISTSIGVDTPSGEPEGPAGPYVTSEHDDEVAEATRRSETSRPSHASRKGQSAPVGPSKKPPQP